MIRPSPEVERRQQFGRLLNARGLKCEAAEIGTDQGVFAAEFLAAWNGLNLVCVDPWRELPGYTDKRIGGDRSPDMFMAVVKLAPFAGRVRFRRATSAEAAACYQDGFFDFVYIDADHSYGQVKQDIKLWWPKLQPNGILAGHDYDPVHMAGVVQAVNEFAERQHVTVWLTNEAAFQSWYVYKTPPRRLFRTFECVMRKIAKMEASK